MMTGKGIRRKIKTKTENAIRKIAGAVIEVAIKVRVRIVTGVVEAEVAVRIGSDGNHDREYIEMSCDKIFGLFGLKGDDGVAVVCGTTLMLVPFTVCGKSLLAYLACKGSK